jgi:hypothetical protein
MPAGLKRSIGTRLNAGRVILSNGRYIIPGLGLSIYSPGKRHLRPRKKSLLVSDRIHSNDIM